MASDIVSALESLTAEEWDRLRLRLWRRFGEQLRKIPEAPDPEDLLQDAIENLLTDKRHCPLDRISLPTCLFCIVRGKVSQIYEKWKKNPVGTKPIEETNLPANTEKNKDEQSEDLQERILALVKDDPLLTRMVKYQLDHVPVPSRELAKALGVNIKDIYNANRRLKSKLSDLNAQYKNKGGNHDSDI